MSVLIESLNASQDVLSAAGGEGILDFITGKSEQATNTMRTVAVLLGIIFVTFQAVQSRGAMARIVTSGIAAAIFIWVVFNVTDLQERVDSEVNSAPAAVSVNEV